MTATVATTAVATPGAPIASVAVNANGHAHARENGAFGIEAGPDEVIVVPGSQYGALLIALTLQKSRNALHFGVPGYLGIPRNFARFGYMVAEAALIQEMARLHWSLSRGTNGLIQRWVAELLASGAIERHVKRMRNVYRRKRDNLASLLSEQFPAWKYRKPGGGLQFFVELGSDAELQHVLAACRETNVAIGVPSVYTLPDTPSRRFIVIGFGSTPFRQIESALTELARAL